jgi:hypothetical protein
VVAPRLGMGRPASSRTAPCTRRAVASLTTMVPGAAHWASSTANWRVSPTDVSVSRPASPSWPMISCPVCRPMRTAHASPEGSAGVG